MLVAHYRVTHIQNCWAPTRWLPTYMRLQPQQVWLTVMLSWQSWPNHFLITSL
jgi:hypothetical protein